MTPESRAALRTALHETSSDLLAYFERRLRARDEAADLLGETMLQAWRRRESLPDETARRRMWLFTIAANVLANHHRSGRRRTALGGRLRDHLSVEPPGPDLVEVYAVRDAVLRLHDAHRELVMLIHWDGFTIVEAAQLLGLNSSTARGRYAAARQSLKAALSDNVYT